MGTKISVREQKGQRHFKSALYSAFFEWALMILLFINALSSYLMHKFARYCKLPTPCILCARLYSKQPCLFKELTCQGHKMEVASLAYCHTHQKLANANKMCDSCHHASEGRVGANHNGGLNGKNYKLLPVVPKKDVETELRCCSCCAVQFKSRPCTLQNKPPRCIEVASLPGSLPRNRVAKEIGKSLRSLANYHTGDHSFERLPQVGYKMAASDSDSEVPFNDDLDDDNDVRSQVSGADMREELLSRCLQATAPTSTETLIQEIPDDMILDKKVIHHSSITPAESCRLINKRNSLASDSQSIVENGNDLEDDLRPSHPKSSEIAFSSKLDFPDVSDSLSAGDAIRALSPADITMRVNQIMNDKLAAGTRSPLPSPAASTEFLSREQASRVPEELRSRLLSQISSARWMEFPTNEMNLSASPRINGQTDEYSKFMIDYPNFQFKKSLSDRCESVLDSLDGSLIMSEVEGEGAVDRLKRQIEVDRKSICILYKELEEERNASAIAANQAMAMITRLQEEKAAMQMEALQYLRMMEEQAGYDQEALQKLNDLLADREKDIQDLEAVIETYSKQYGGEPLMGRVLVDSAFDAEESRDQYTHDQYISTPKFMRSRGRENRKTLMRNTLMLDFDEEKAYISSCLRRLERKLQMIANGGTTTTDHRDVGTALNAIKELDNNFTPTTSSLLIDQTTTTTTTSRPPEFSVPFEEDDQKGTIVVPERELSPFREDSMLRTCSSPFAHSVKFSLNEALKESRLRSFSCNARQQLQLLGSGKGISEIVSLGNEVSQLSVRLEALEEDRNFLEHTASSLRNGSDGLQFIQEIASHLRELRKVCATQQEELTVA